MCVLGCVCECVCVSTCMHHRYSKLQEGHSLIDGQSGLSLWHVFAKVQQIEDIGHPCCAL